MNFRRRDDLNITRRGSLRHPQAFGRALVVYINSELPIWRDRNEVDAASAGQARDLQRPETDTAPSAQQLVSGEDSKAKHYDQRGHCESYPNLVSSNLSENILCAGN